jgi:hypothetical protein
MAAHVLCIRLVPMVAEVIGFIVRKLPALLFYMDIICLSLATVLLVIAKRSALGLRI